MSMQTYFVVQPYLETERGTLVASPPIQARDADHARRLVSRQAGGVVGAIAFSRRVDPDSGEYEEACVLLRWGRVPDDEDQAAA